MAILADGCTARAEGESGGCFVLGGGWGVHGCPDVFGGNWYAVRAVATRIVGARIGSLALQELSEGSVGILAGPVRIVFLGLEVKGEAQTRGGILSGWTDRGRRASVHQCFAAALRVFLMYLLAFVSLTGRFINPPRLCTVCELSWPGRLSSMTQDCFEAWNIHHLLDYRTTYSRCSPCEQFSFIFLSWSWSWTPEFAIHLTVE